MALATSESRRSRIRASGPRPRDASTGRLPSRLHDRARLVVLRLNISANLKPELYHRANLTPSAPAGTVTSLAASVNAPYCCGQRRGLPENTPH